MTLFFVVIVLVAIIPSMFLVAFGNGANPISAARLAVCAGLGIVAALISAFFLTRSITRPLKELRRRIEILSTGNLDQKFLLERNDEIGELALDIDRMRRYLKFRIIELEKLFRVGKAISSELDFKQLLNIILDTIIGEIGAESGSIMLLNEEDKYLTIAVAKHLPEDVINNTRVFLGEGIVGKVAETGERIMIEDVENSEVFKKQKNEGVNRGGSLLSVPLKVKDKTLGTEKVLGVINVSKSEAGAFRYHDLEFFSGMATQAAIAIFNAKLYRLATTDSMTKLFLKGYFHHKLDEEIIRSKRYKNPVSVIMMDIDHFKNFNDTYGHQVGDEVLKTVAAIMEDSVRAIDTVARYGGEEFVVICPEMDADHALHPAERIRSMVEYHDFRINEKKVPITISLGIASYPTDAVTRKDLIRRADEALYASKEQGRNRASVYHQVQEFGIEVPVSKKEK